MPSRHTWNPLALASPLTCSVGWRIAPWALDTLLKHYYDRLLRRWSRSPPASPSPNIRHQDLFYDQCFVLFKSAMEHATRHTIEDLQDFFNTHIPAIPSVHLVRQRVPLSCCDDAAALLVTAFGGAEAMKRLVGGTRWWQVRGVNGVNAHWIACDADILDIQMRRRSKRDNDAAAWNWAGVAPGYHPAMDDMPCILYFHGGGYYFGSADSERITLQRYARNIHGRVFAVDYRLAPQYPFPCAIQDVLAAYLYLIRPPPGAPHAAVAPARLVLGGDSAGGGLTLALLQLLRDLRLPLPAGAVLASPWCDLAHAFPSVLQNTATDVIPEYGLALHKPSALWAPPALDQAPEEPARDAPQHAPEPGPGPAPLSDDQTLSLGAASGETIRIDQQVQFYTSNALVPHPLVSPVHAYLGGLPPLLVIASDKEVLRDEIIYTAHKAARPDQYPLSPQAKALYAPLDGIESRHKPTRVHLQVYDETGHTLPVLFPFSAPAAHCFRSIAAFCRHVMHGDATPARARPRRATWGSVASFVHHPTAHRPMVVPVHGIPSIKVAVQAEAEANAYAGRKSRAVEHDGKCVYTGARGGSAFKDHMIRERISTSGVVRALEPEAALPALALPPHRVGVVSELAARRYIAGRVIWDSEFAGAACAVASGRRAREGAVAELTRAERGALLQRYFVRGGCDCGAGVGGSDEGGKTGACAPCCWAWVLDAEERPPAASVAGRRDIEEAARLASVADGPAVE